MHQIRIIWLVVLCAFVLRIDARAQANRLVSVDDWAYTYIERLQRRGYLLELNPTALPYTQGEIARALERVPKKRLARTEQYWVDLLKRRVAVSKPRDNSAFVGGHLQAGAATTNNDRLDPLRQTDAGNPLIQEGDVRLYSNAALQVYVDRSPFVAQMGLVHSIFYDTDPDGLDAVNRLYVRNEEAYAGVNTKYASVYLGRYATHWGPYSSPAVLVSANPRSYDMLTLRVGGERFALRSMLAELDAMSLDGAFTGRANDDPDRHGINRYLAAHRLDWRPRRSLAFSVSESALYSGRGAGPSLKFASPVHTFLFLIDNRPKNEEHNGLLAGSVWLHHSNVTASAQMMVDDFDFINRNEPSSIAAATDITYAPSPTVDLGASFHIVTALAYNTHQPEGRYLYMLRGLASEFSDFVQVGAFASFYPLAIPSLSITPEITALWQGETRITDPFPVDPTGRKTVLTGVVERTTRVGARIAYQPDPRIWIATDLGVNVVSNVNHWPGDDRTSFVGLLEFGTRLSLNRSYRLSFPDRRDR